MSGPGVMPSTIEASHEGGKDRQVGNEGGEHGMGRGDDGYLLGREAGGLGLIPAHGSRSQPGSNAPAAARSARKAS